MGSASLVLPILGLLSGAGGEVVTYSGYIIDFYCLGLVEAGGSSLDGSDVIKEPWEHTLHCLRDIRQCREGYYLAENVGGNYRVKFALDDASKNNAIALMNTFPKGSDRDYQSFAVTAVGQHMNNDGILRDATFTTCFANTGCDSVCTAANETFCETPDGPANFTMPTSSMLSFHVVCMCVSWGCLLPLGVLWARNMRTSTRKTDSGAPIWFVGHRTLQSAGVGLQFLGFVFVYLHKGAGHFKQPHEILGLVVVILGLLQPVNAQLRHLDCIGHPKPDGTRSAARRVWEYYHKGCGWLCLLGGLVNLCLGPWYAGMLRFGSPLVVGSAVFLVLSLGGITIAGLYLEVQRPSRSSSKAAQDRGQSGQMYGAREE